jgi:hypothetical protein
MDLSALHLTLFTTLSLARLSPKSIDVCREISVETIFPKERKTLGCHVEDVQICLSLVESQRRARINSIFTTLHGRTITYINALPAK